jgi:hypothetical protein
VGDIYAEWQKVFLFDLLFLKERQFIEHTLLYLMHLKLPNKTIPGRQITNCDLLLVINSPVDYKQDGK